MRELADLRDRGILTESEFQSEKAKLLQRRLGDSGDRRLVVGDRGDRLGDRGDRVELDWELDVARERERRRETDEIEDA